MSEDVSPWLQFVGRLHPMVLHLPIGLLTGLAALESATALPRLSVSRGATRLLAWLTAAAAALTAGTGYILGLEGVNDAETVAWHQNLGIAVAVACVLMAAAHTLTSRKLPYRLLLGMTLILLVPAGHLGASMTHGAKFLTEPFASPPAKPAATAGDTSTEQDVYAAVVAPILADRCGGCHGESRQKSGLALHTPEAITKGGKHGPVLVPGKPAESEIIRRLRLPLDEDDHMPPVGKPQPTEEEVQAVEAWIADGAPVRDDSPGDKGHTPESSAGAEAGVPAPATAALSALEAFLVHAEAVTAGSNLLAVHFAAAAKQTDDDDARRLLEPLLENLDTLVLSQCSVGDELLAVVSVAPHLRRLDLTGTQITAAGLEPLSRLESLEELVLVQTQLTDDAMEHLAAMPALQRVYVWQSGLSEDAIAGLRERRPELAVDAGDSPEAKAEDVEPDLVFTSDAPLPGEPAPAANLKPVNTTCPVSGKPVDPQFAVIFKNRVIGFCCPNCPAQFWADPSKFEGKLGISD